MTHKKPESKHKGTQGGPPVMCCPPAKGEVTTRLERGSTPSTPDRAHRHDQHNGHANASHHGHGHHGQASHHDHAKKEKRRRWIKNFFRVTPEENAIILVHAAEAGLEKSSYLRNQALGESKARKCRRIRADWDKLRQCMGSINKAGNVVNQYIKLFRWFGIGNTAEADKAFNDLSITSRLICTILRRSK
jgi:hypothetical protein